MACSPLPDVDDERDITTFVSLWQSDKDKSLSEAIQQCQIAEDVITSMQNISGEAIAMSNYRKLEWCRDYTKQMRDIELKKWNDICAYVLEYMEQYTRLTPEEIEAQKDQKQNRGKGDQNQRSVLELKAKTKDLLFRIWANV